MTPETLSELKSLLEKAKQEEEEGLWEATENTSDLMIFLSKHGKELIKAVEQRDRYRAALEKAITDMAILGNEQEYDEERSICKDAIKDIDEALKDTKEETNDSVV